MFHLPMLLVNMFEQ